MTQQQLATKQLLERQATLTKRRNTAEADITSLSTEKRGEELAENDELADVMVLLSAQESAELKEIDAALLRLERGTWGLCEVCEEQIPAKRLKLRPEARACATCLQDGHGVHHEAHPMR